MGRIETICSYLNKCTSFADIGCDHGYCTRYMLDNGLCERATITDISAKSLQKAQNLLKKYIDGGRCNYICTDGLKGVDENCDLVLIAGMGGEEIIKILKEAFIPKNFVFQPMKNAPLLRKFLLQNGCKIERDDIFKDGKFYFIIKGSLCCGNESSSCGNENNLYYETESNINCGNKTYTKAQLAFGRDSLNNSLLKDYLDEEIKKNEDYILRGMKDESRAALIEKIAFLKGVRTGEIK
jgi:tRNA A22 N-methylase